MFDGRPDPNAWFFAMPKGSKIISLADQFSAVLQMAGREKDGKGDRFSLYSIRHFYAVLALREGIGIYDIARNMGTSVEIIQQYYGRQATPQMMATKLGGKLKPTHKLNTDAE